MKTHNHSGIFHSAPNFTISRYDFSKKLAKFLDLDENLIIPTTTSKLERNVATGLNKCLNSEKLTSTDYNFMTLNESFELIKQQINP